MAALASDWLRHLWLLLWNRWTEFNETWQEARSQRPLPSLCFSGRSEKQDGRPGLWLAETFSTSPLKPLNGIQRNLTGSKISTSSTKFVCFGPIGKKTRWPPWPLIGWDNFDFSSETAERNSTKLDRKQDLNVFYQLCIFRADRKIKMAALTFDWLRNFWLLLWNRWTEFNETWQEARSQCPLPRMCFSGRSEKQDGRPDLLLAEKFLTSPLKPLNRIQRNLAGSKISTSSNKFVFFGPIWKTRWPPWPLIGWDIFDFSSETAERNSTKLDRKQDLNVLYQVCMFRADRKKKQDGHPGIWLAETFLTSPLKPLNGIQRNLTGSKISTSSTKFVFFGPIGKTRWPPWPLIGWDIFDFSSETAERNSTKLDRKQDLYFLYQVCVFRADLKNKMAALASDWLRHLWLLLWNRWTEFNETWQEARSQRPLPSLYVSGQSEKTRWPPWPLIGWDIFNFSSETAERNSTKLDRKQDLNVLYQVCVFRADRKNKMAALAVDVLRNFWLLLWNRWTELNETWQEARSQRPLPSLCFSGRSKKQDGRPGFWLAETFSTSPLKPLNGIQRNLTGSKISTSSTKFVFIGTIGKNKMAALASDWLRHFQLLLWNRWTEFNEYWQEARSQRPLPSLCFSGRSEKQDGRPGLWLAETFSISPLKPLNGIQRNLTGSNISLSSTKFVFFGPISKQKCPSWPISQRGGTLYSGARYVALWASCFCFTNIKGNTVKWRSSVTRSLSSMHVLGKPWTDENIPI